MSAEAERWREACHSVHAEDVTEAGDALVAALEAREERIAELEAGLRRIILSPAYAKTDESIAIARDLLPRRAGGADAVKEVKPDGA